MLQLAYDAKRLFRNFTGLGNYGRTLVKDLADQFPEHAYYLYSPRVEQHPQNQFFQDHPSFPVRTNRFQPNFYWRSFGLKRQLRKDGVQLYHGLSNEIPFGIHRLGIKSVVSIHDLIFKYFPQQYPWSDRQIYDFKFKYACRNADHIIAISEHTKKDIIRYYQIPENKISVIYQSCAAIYHTLLSDRQIEQTRKRYDLPKNYLLYVGAINERKNLLNLIKALPLLPKSIQVPLVVVGKGRNYQEQVKMYVQQHGLDQQVIWLSFAEQNDLPALYQAARVFIYPSFHEGFGIPIIEALHSKTPVITSQQSALPEAAGPGAYYVDPKSAEQIAVGLEKILTDTAYAKSLTKKGYQHVQKFNNIESSKAVMELYKKMLNK